MGNFLGNVRQVSFGPFTVDFDTRELRREGRALHVSPKAYELLCVLLEQRPKAIAKPDLHERLWPATFVSEATLASLVAELREALGERGREARFIRTVHSFGYAFAAEVLQTAVIPPPAITSWIVRDGQEQSLGDGEHVIGRDADVTLCLSSPTVSRRHARIVVAGDVATLEDLGSKNGTYVRGQRVTTPVPLADGDRIRIGAFELTYRSLAADAATETQHT